MATPRHLNNAPITEALIDVRATPSQPDPAEILSSLVQAVAADYPQVDEHRGLRISIDLSRHPSHASGTNTDKDGYVCRSADGRNIVQFRNDGFTFNRLHPYTSWDEILPEALRLWGLYNAATTPQVFRIAVRYINQLEIPAAGASLSRYLTMPPKAPSGPNQEVAAFFSRVVVRDKLTGATAAVVQARDPGLSTNLDVLILDIDASKGADGEQLSADDVAPTLDELRTMKNQMFFDSLEEPALEKYL